MIKKIVKAATRTMLGKVHNYLHTLDEERERNRDYGGSDFAYPWLNALFREIHREGNGRLRPAYIWGVLHGVFLAKTLGVERVSVLELGVAGGNGLVSLERIAEKTEAIFQVGIDVYGFDTGRGLPKPDDYRDLPNLYTENGFPMNVEELRKHLRKAQLQLGLVGDTVPAFIESGPAPISFISFDLDYYSSTMDAFKLLEGSQNILLPRVHCYFDDIMGFTFSEFNGVRLAISEFNTCHNMRKISPIYGLKYFLPASYTTNDPWVEKYYIAHIFDHKLYGQNDGLVRRPFGGSTDLTGSPKGSEIR